MNNKCLVSEAREKCKCEYCKQNRKLAEIALRWHIKEMMTDKIINAIIEGKEKKGMSSMGIKIENFLDKRMWGEKGKL